MSESNGPVENADPKVIHTNVALRLALNLGELSRASGNGNVASAIVAVLSLAKTEGGARFNARAGQYLIYLDDELKLVERRMELQDKVPREKWEQIANVLRSRLHRLMVHLHGNISELAKLPALEIKDLEYWGELLLEKDEVELDRAELKPLLQLLSALRTTANDPEVPAALRLVLTEIVERFMDAFNAYCLRGGVALSDVILTAHATFARNEEVFDRYRDREELSRLAKFWIEFIRVTKPLSDGMTLLRAGDKLVDIAKMIGHSMQ